MTITISLIIGLCIGLAIGHIGRRQRDKRIKELEQQLKENEQ